jgi:cysteinyl-tRNA synthetase
VTVGEVLGIGKKSPASALADLEKIKKDSRAASGASLPSEEEIQAMIAARADARKNKNFAEGDRIRDELASRGVIIKDSPTGTTWTYKS